MPRHGSTLAKIATRGNSDAALAGKRDELLDGDRCQDALPEELRHPAGFCQLERTACQRLSGSRIEHPIQPTPLGIPAAAFDLVPTDVLPGILIAVRERSRTGN